MTLSKYQRLAERTINKSLPVEENRLHALHGMVGEIGEIHSIYQKYYQGHQLDEAELRKETGDLLWFLAEYCTVMGWRMEDIAEENIEKLQKRYPYGFTEEASINRAE